MSGATNPAVNVGANFNVAQSTSGGSFFSNGVTGDCILRQTSTSNAIRIGVGSATAQFDVNNTAINLNVNPNITSATNPTLTIGANTNVSQVTSAGTFFSNTGIGDTVVRNSSTSLSVQMGVGSGSAQIQIENTKVDFRVNPSLIASVNPSLDISSNTNVAQVTSAGTFFSTSASGDTIVRNASTSQTLRMGIGTGTEQLNITNTQINANVTIACAGSLSIAQNATITGTLGVALGITAGSLSLPTTGGTAGNLDYYEESAAFNISMSTPDGTNHNLPVTATRIGKIVVIQSSGLSVTSNSAAKFSAAAGQIPARFRPSVGQGFIDNIQNNTVGDFGLFVFGTDGAMHVGVGVADGNFANTGTATILTFSFSYLTS
jgi:hypothetical protein